MIRIIGIIFITILLLTVLVPTPELAFGQQWFNPQTLQCIVLIEKLVQGRYAPLGTGFLVTGEREDGKPILITAKHLMKRDKIFISIPADSEIITYASKYQTTRFKIGDTWWHLTGERLRCEFETINKGLHKYVTHSDTAIDIAAFPLDVGTSLEKNGEILKVSKIALVPKNFYESKKNVQLGDDIYFVGYPFGLGSSDPLSPVLRSGTVAWIGPTGSEFLLDAMSYGGNSGSPVFTKATITKEFGVIANTPVYLIGMIFGHLKQDYPLLKIDTIQEQEALVVDTVEIENLGLAKAVWIDEILEVVKKASLIKLDE